MSAVLVERGEVTGLPYAVVCVPSLSLAAVHLTFRGGLLHHPQSQGQLPHLLEHLAARGPEGEGSTFAAQLERRGILFNARVHQEFTSYELRVPIDGVRQAVRDVTALAFSPVSWTQDHICTEQRVIADELLGSSRQVAHRVASELLARLYPDLAAAFDTEQATHSVQALTLEDVLAFRAKHHTRAGALLLLFTPQKVLPDWLAEVYSPPEGALIPWIQSPRTARGEHITLRGGGVCAYGVAFEALPFSHPDALALQLSYGLMGYGLGSALYRGAVLERGLTYHISTYVDALHSHGHVAFHARVQSPPLLTVLESVMRDAIDSLATGRWEHNDLTRARARYVSRLLLETERPDLHLARLTKQLLYTGDVHDVQDTIHTLYSVSPDQVTALWSNGRRWSDRVSVTLHAHHGEFHARR